MAPSIRELIGDQSSKMAKVEKYASIEAFTKKVGEYYEFIKKLHSKKIHAPITISFKSEEKIPGMIIHYEISAEAKYGSATFAKYYDHPLRVHNSMEDGSLNLEEEETEFRGYILESLQRRDLPAKLSELEISLAQEDQ